MERLQLMNVLLDKSTMTIQEMTDKIGVNRSNYYLWRDGKTVPKKATINKLAELLEVRLVWDGSNSVEIADNEGVQVEDNQITIEGDKKVNSTANKISTNDLLTDLEEKRGYIGYLKNEIAQLKSALNRKAVENASFDSQPYDCLFDVSIGFGLRGITRTVNSITNSEMFPKMLGYTKQEMEDYWDIGVKHRFSKHPIDKIIDKDSREKFKKQSEDLPSKMKDEESIIGDHFYQMTYYYIHKEGHKVPVNVTAKILWWEKKIVCKLNFMND